MRFGFMLYNTNLYEHGITYTVIQLHSENAVYGLNASSL